MSSELFRAVNERIRALSDTAAELDFVCECHDDHCTRVMRMRAQEYEDVIAQPGRFAVLPGHDAWPGDEIVGYTERFVVVRPHAALAATQGG